MISTFDPVSTFSGLELALAGRMSVANFDLMIREGIVPPAASPGKRNSPARWPFSVVSLMVLTAVLSRVTDSPVMAGRIARGIMEELKDTGKSLIPFGLDDLSRKLSLEMGRDDDIRGPDGEICPYRTIETAWRTGILRDDQAAKNDFVLVIVDGELVGETPRNGMKFLSQYPTQESAEARAILSYQYGGKASGLQVNRLQSEAAEAMFRERLENAESVLQLNLSLAVRRAVVGIIRHREAA